MFKYHWIISSLVKEFILCGIYLFASDFACAEVSDTSTQNQYIIPEISNIRNQPVRRGEGVIFDKLHVNEGLDIILTVGSSVEKTNSMKNNKVWVLVRSLDTRDYRVYGPAKSDYLGAKNSVIHNVFLRNADDIQTKHFLLLTGISTPEQNIKDGDTIKSLDQFLAVSSPISIAVLQWISETSELAIESINGHPIELQTPMVVENYSTISVVSSDIRDNKDSKVYLIIHPENSKTWRVAGCVRVRDKRWNCSQVLLTEPNQINSDKIDVFAIQSNQSLNSGLIDYEVIKDWLGKSSSIQVIVRDTVVRSSPSPKVKIVSYQNLKGEIKKLSNSTAIELSIDDSEISLEMTSEALPEGKKLWALLNPIGTSIWIVQEGPAKEVESSAPATSQSNSAGSQLNGQERKAETIEAENPANMPISRWLLPSIRLQAPRDSNINNFRLLLVASNSQLIKGTIDYNKWQEQVTIVSDPVIIKKILPEDKPTDGNSQSNMSVPVDQSAGQSDTTLSIVRVAEKEVNSENDVTVASRGAVEVEVDKILSPPSQVWIGKKEADEEDWIFAPTIKTQTVWVRPDMVFDKNVSLISIVTQGPLPVTQGDFDWWRHYAIATSPIVKVNHIPEQTSSTTVHVGEVQGENSVISWFWIIVVLLVVLIITEFFWGLVSEVAKEISTMGHDIASYIQGQLGEIPKPQVVESIIGLSMMALGIFSIMSYFPFYKHVLRTVLNLTRQESHSLALLFVMSIIMGGMLWDIDRRYGGHKHEKETMTNGKYDKLNHEKDDSSISLGDQQVQEKHWFSKKNQKKSAVKKQAGSYESIFYLIFFCFAIFQGILFYNFGEVSMRQKSDLISLYWALVASVILGIEVFVFSFSIRLASNFIAWLAIHVFLLTPPIFLMKIAFFIEKIFTSIPSKTRP
ncbi:MAG: hypothetical protein U1F76_24920 [Candidatus Competibacteraceae bacterium]